VNANGHPLDALADPTRRQIFERLRSGPLAVGTLADGLPVSRPAVSQHLRVLKDAGLVVDTKDGTRRLYAVAPDGVRALREWFDAFWSDALEAYADAAAERAQKEERP
jgi:DNA-binding transcriptional ArsR family regulator